MEIPENPIPENGVELSELGDKSLAELLVTGSEMQRKKVATIIYSKNRERVEGYILSRCQRSEDATVICENVWNVFWDKVFGFKWEGKPFIAWIMTIVNIQIKAYYSRTPPILSLQELEEKENKQALLNKVSLSIATYIDDELEGITLSSASKEIREEVDRMIQVLLEDLMNTTLNEKERRIFELSYYRGLSFSQIAKRLNMKPGTVRVKHTRALDKLRNSSQSQLLEKAWAARQS